MYSGSDSTGSQNFNQWPLNPAAYQNTPNEQIDWAALAQQWIIMKEAGPPVPDQIPTTTPPLNIQKAKKESLPEGGEAPMEVENDREDDAQPHWNDNTSSTEGYWNQQQQWGWGNTWSAPAGVPPPGIAKAPLLPTPPSYQYSCPSDNTSNFGGYNRPPSSEYSGGYWTATGNKMKPHNKRYSKVNVPPRPTIAPTTPEPVMLDASKRKQLPAWIREGLEKMERDKQKQLEKERDKIEKEDHKEKSKLNEKEALEIIKSTVKERERSKFESDGEDSEIEINKQEKVSEPSESLLLTQEELMLKLRRTMTEILLKVTNQEIRAVCKEEFQRHLRKYKASDLRISASGGTNISAKLGLGIYGDSASSSEEMGDESEQDKNDSDAELKDTIKRRKAEFTKTEREIEERLGAAGGHIDDDSKGGTPKADDCDSQVDAKSQGHKLKLNEDITPPKNVSSVSKRFKSRRTSTSSSTKSDTEHDKHVKQKDKKLNRPKKSSSTESNHSQKRSKTRNKRSHPSKDTRSITPERKKLKDKNRHSTDKKTKHSESSSSKSSSSRSRKSRSKSLEVLKKKRLRLSDKYGRDNTNNRRSYSRRSNTRSSSRSRRSRSYSRSHRSESRRRSRSYTKSDKFHKSRSRSRSDHSLNSRSWAKSERSQKSRSRDRRSRSTNRSRTSRSRQKSKSYSPRSHRHRRLKSRSSSRGKRSHRH